MIGSRGRLGLAAIGLLTIAGFTESDFVELFDAADCHGYEDTVSGYLGDISLAFIQGEFTVDLPLHTDRRALQDLRAEVRLEINAIGNNINQMVHVLHRDDRLVPDSRERLIRVESLLRDMARALLLPTTSPEGGEPAWSPLKDPDTTLVACQPDCTGPAATMSTSIRTSCFLQPARLG